MPPRIERAGLHDLPGAYRVCLLTGDSGSDASGLFDDPDLIGHLYVGPYLARGAGTQLVVVDELGVAGYLLSADDTAALEAWAEDHWWPALRERYPLQERHRLRVGGSEDAKAIRQIHSPERTPAEVAKTYPAHLHIDLVERVRGLGLGRALIEALLAELRDRSVSGVHMGVDPGNDNAIGFYGHLGFREIARDPDTLLMGMPLA